MSDFENTALRAIEEWNMLGKADTVVAALSGGADSVSLFNLLISIREKYSLDIKAAHINHNLRGEEALRDENFVRKICAENDVELFVKSVDINKVAENEKISTELAGRNERYRFFKELSVKYDAKVATAHTADDNAETVIFNLIRGAGLNGMCGIKPVRDYIIRPLIYLSRAEVERYCGKNNLDYVTDSSNLTDDYTRNKIRHSLIPVMREINPRFIKTVSEEAKLFNEINSFLELKANEYIRSAKTENGYSVSALKKIPGEIRPSVIYRLLKLNGIMPERKHISLIGEILPSGAVDLNDGFRAVSKQGVLRFVKTDDNIKYFSDIELKIPLSFSHNGKKYSVEELNSKGALKPSLLNENIVFRTRRAGDTFTLPGRRVTKTLKKLFNELKIPEESRDKIIVLAKGSEIMWIEGIGAGERALAYDNSGFTIKIERK